MRIARRLGATVLLVTLTAGLVFVWNRPRAVESHAPVVAESPEPAGLIHGFVVSRVLDLRHWSLRATPLRFEPEPVVHVAEINSRGRFEFPGLADMDYRVELVAEGVPPTVLASADYVRPGREELMLDVDPLQLAGLTGSLALNK